MPTRSSVRPAVRPPPARPLWGKKSLGTFFVLLLLTFGSCALTIGYKAGLQQATMEKLVTEKSIRLHQVVARLLYKTQALAALVIQGSGEVDDFERIAAAIVDDPSIVNILAAPGGTVAHIYPLEGNERAVGFSLLGEGRGNREAIAAAKSGDLVIGGPFELVQGGLALAGRFPVMLDSPSGGKYFWGLVSVTLRYPDVLEAAKLDEMDNGEFAYELWRMNPDDGTRQVIMRSSSRRYNDARYLERRIRIFNAEWYLRILPVRAWYEVGENWMMIGAAFCVSLLAAAVVRKNECLVSLQAELEILLRTDPLTGLLNRRGLFQKLQAMVDKGEPFSIFYFDLNRFKQINDAFGHAVGDLVLAEFGRRVSSVLPPDAFFSRMGGDEFVLAFPGEEDETFENGLGETLTAEFEDPVLAEGGARIMLRFSLGKAVFPDDGRNADTLVSCADLRMFDYKRAKYSQDRRRRASDLLDESAAEPGT